MQNRSPNESVVDKIVAHVASREAMIAVNEITKNSCILEQEKERAVPRYSREQLVLGSLLGRGGFCDVYEIKKITEATEIRRQCMRRNSMPMIGKSPSLCEESVGSSSSDDEEKEQAESNARFFRRKKTSSNSQYAVKFLSLSTMTNPSKFATGAADLAIESHFLASLDHPNIMKLKGVSNGGIEGFSEGRGGGYFLLLERLVENLDVRLDRWQQKRTKSGFFSQGNIRQRYLARSLVIAHDVANALEYMHSQNIMFRDLKPENVGFDVNDDIKIFDFGLAKELRSADRLDDGLYNLTGNTGSPRYMAPEVGKSKPYNLSADVYSFSILLWKLCSLEQPFSGMDSTTHYGLVINGPYRPPLDEEWPIGLRSIMEEGWSSDANERPYMKTFCTILLQQVSEMVNVSVESKLRRRVSRAKSMILTKG